MLSPKAVDIRFVFSKEQFLRAFALQRILANPRVRSVNHLSIDLTQDGLGLALAPRPCISEPERREYIDLCGLRTAIVDGDFDEGVFRISFGIFNKDIEVSIVIENSGVEKFVL